MVVRPAMLYSLEVTALMKRQETELREADLKMLMFLLGVTWMGRFRNEFIGGTGRMTKQESY